MWLNVYDLMIMNYTINRVGLGVYHTGVEVYGRGARNCITVRNDL